MLLISSCGAHALDQRQHDRRRHLLHDRRRNPIRNRVVDDRLRLLGRRRRLAEHTQCKQTAVARRILIEQDPLGTLGRLDVVQRVKTLHRLTRDQHRAVEPVAVRLTLTQVTRDLRAQRARRVLEQTERLGRRLDLLRLHRRLLCVRRCLCCARLLGLTTEHLVQHTRDRARAIRLRPRRRLGRNDGGHCPPLYSDLARRLAAVDEVEHTNHLVRRQLAQHRQTDFTVADEVAQDQRDREHLLVVAHVAVIGVPCGQTHVEARILRAPSPCAPARSHPACGAASSAACSESADADPAQP